MLWWIELNNALQRPEIGSFTLLATATASSSSTVDFTNITSQYLTILFVLEGLIPSVDGAALHMRVSTDNGATYKAGATDYAWSRVVAVVGSVSGGGDVADAQINIKGALGTAANEDFSAYLFMTGHTASNRPTAVMGGGFHIDNTPDIDVYVGGGTYLADTAVNAVRFLPSSGTIVTGEFRVYGLLNT
jgi:hypothetical protein